MLKPVAAAVALIALGGSGYVYAQQDLVRYRHDGDGPRAEQRHRPSPADMAAFTDARIAALKAGLELTPDQAKNWPAFEQSLRDLAQIRVQRMQEREAQGDQPQGSPFDRLSQRADMMAKASVALKKVADAGAPLYQSLDDAQKARFTRLARMLRPRFDQGWGPRHRFGEGDGPGERGFGPHGQRFGDNSDKLQGRMQDPSDNDAGSRL
jgi:hypothetical protein